MKSIKEKIALFIVPALTLFFLIQIASTAIKDHKAALTPQVYGGGNPYYMFIDTAKKYNSEEEAFANSIAYKNKSWYKPNVVQYLWDTTAYNADSSWKVLYYMVQEYQDRSDLKRIKTQYFLKAGGTPFDKIGDITFYREEDGTEDVSKRITGIISVETGKLREISDESSSSELDHTINQKTHKRHNSGCRYYDCDDCVQCGDDEGTVCKVCGG